MKQIQDELAQFGRNLGNPQNDFVILGEGNISGKENEKTFWVKASGTSLKNLMPENLVEVGFEKISRLLSRQQLSDDEIREGLQNARVDKSVEAMPSVETFLHSILLQLPGINFIGHTHPTAVNAILCSKMADEAYSGLLYPDQIVYCGPAPVFIPYTDPGQPLALKVGQKVEEYINSRGIKPKILLMQNHGLIALGATTREVENITAMTVKAARVILGTYTLGGPNFLSDENVERIYSRPDEKYRMKAWGVK